MGKAAFSDDEVAYLRSLPAVRHATSRRIMYTEEFKRELMTRYVRGESPTGVFREAGLGPERIGRKRIERCVAHWRERAAAPFAVQVPAMGSGPEGITGTQGADGVDGVTGADGFDVKDAIIAQQSRYIAELEHVVQVLRRNLDAYGMRATVVVGPADGRGGEPADFADGRADDPDGADDGDAASHMMRAAT